MNYLKDIIIECNENNIDKTNIKYYMPKQISPYIEINQEDLNTLELVNNKENKIGVNPYFNNEKIFWELLSPNNILYPQLKKLIFNVLCHFIAETDYLSLKRVGDYILKFIEKAIINGEYGDIVKEFYELFSREEKEKILNEMVIMYRIGGNIERFLAISNKIFSGSITYDCSEEKNIIDMYLPFKKDCLNSDKLDFLVEMFLPINLSLKTYWEYHFAIIGIDETSVIDECRIF